MARPPAPPVGPPSDAERAETRAAIRLVAACALVAVALYAAVVAVVHEEAWFTRLGRGKGVMFALREVRTFDRASVAGDAPITWIVGSSIVRDAFDAERIEARLAAGGSPHRVVKVAFNRGTPIFGQAILDDLPVRPGDRVVTGVAEDNFVWSWLTETADFTLYVQSVLTPDEILALRDVPLSTRLEWSAGAWMPGSFARSRDDFRKGLNAWVGYHVGLRERPPKLKDARAPFIATKKTIKATNRQDWSFPLDALTYAPGQANWDGLTELIVESRARGADVQLVYVPSHPWYYERFCPESVTVAFEAEMRALDAPFARLRPRRGEAYRDFKHPNDLGRPGFSDDLADLLLRAEGRAPPPRDADPSLAGDGDAPAALLAPDPTWGP